MVVLVIDQDRVLALERKGKSPIVANAYSPMVGKISFESMQLVTRSIHVLGHTGYVESSEKVAQTTQLSSVQHFSQRVTVSISINSPSQPNSGKRSLCSIQTPALHSKNTPLQNQSPGIYSGYLIERYPQHATLSAVSARCSTQRPTPSLNLIPLGGAVTALLQSFNPSKHSEHDGCGDSSPDTKAVNRRLREYTCQP